MPVTPFHFGVGGLAKGVAPRRVSLTAFAVSQVVIDLEPAYYILTRQWPLHRWTHRLIVAIPLAAAVGLGIWLIFRLMERRVPASWRRSPEIALAPGLVGGVLGGATHPLLDGVMHSDVVPFWPVLTGNPLQGLVDVTALHLLCVGAAAVGFLLWVGRRPMKGAEQAPSR